MEAGKKPNRLIHEKSPYLLQHAFNPVDWYTWSDEAFVKARAEQKPIFLSIGYSTCHWCHVMEHESFEVDSIAELMNKYFVCIKLDREERPDIDRVYMTALQSMGQGGGWPMSMFLTPDLKPFYGGTYFPPETRYGRVGFPDLLRRIHELWETDRVRLVESANGIAEHLQQLVGNSTADSLPERTVLDTCFTQFERSYDPTFGGFSGAPKFPRPSVLNFLMRYSSRSGKNESLTMATQTLRKMSAGGIYDHIGGGLHRYSVDGEWRVPHFEKMLYDQAQLVNAYLDVYLLTRDEYFAGIARDVLDYVMRDMTDKQGGFYSAEDADSRRPENAGELGEGAFYVWTRSEIAEVLGAEDAAVFSFYHGVEDSGNASIDPQQEFTGKNILYVAHTVQETARELGWSEKEILQLLVGSRTRLLEARSKRPRPRLDDKILTSWNGLMISSFARAYQVLDEPKYLDAAQRAAEFVFNTLYDKNKKILLRRYRDGEAKFEAHLDDYAFLVQGLLDLYESSFELRWFERALELTETQLSFFWDERNWGFFDTSGKDSSVLMRTKEQYDGAEPSGNSIGVMNLLRLAEMTDKKEWRQKAEQALMFFGQTLGRSPQVMPQMVSALDFILTPSTQIIIVGKRDDPATKRLLREVYTRYLPGRVLHVIEPGEQQQRLAHQLSFVSAFSMVDGKATAYVCENFVCQLPTTDVKVMQQILDGRK